MRCATSEHFISNRAWLRNAVKDENVVLKNVSALEFLQLFVGYACDEEIEVYAREKGKYDNIKYHVIDDFDSIDYAEYGQVRCASFNQVLNDMLSEFETTDEQALSEALNKYYYANNQSFDNLIIKAENQQRFHHLIKQAEQYYCGG